MFHRFKIHQAILIFHHSVRWLKTSSSCATKVAVFGASGGIGQPLSLLLKTSPLITELTLYDIAHTVGVAADLTHIETKCKVTGYVGPDQIKDSLTGVQVLLITTAAGKPFKMDMVRDDMFRYEASIVRDIVESAAEVAPKALIAIVTNPINSLVPMAAQVLKKAGVYDPRRLFGIITLDVVRANTFVAQAAGLDPLCIDVPVIGGHSETTIVPLISQCTPKVVLSKEQIVKTTDRIVNAHMEVLKGKGSTSTLAPAYSVSRFICALCKALNGEPDIVECAYVQSKITDAKFFATPILFGTNGVEKNLGLGKLSEYETNLFKTAVTCIKKEVEKGEAFIMTNKTGPKQQKCK